MKGHNPSAERPPSQYLTIVLVSTEHHTQLFQALPQSWLTLEMLSAFMIRACQCSRTELDSEVQQDEIQIFNLKIPSCKNCAGSMLAAHSGGCCMLNVTFAQCEASVLRLVVRHMACFICARAQNVIETSRGHHLSADTLNDFRYQILQIRRITTADLKSWCML